MASTNFTVYGFLGYEVVIDGSVETNVLFAIADEKKALLAWYGFKTNPAKWHQDQFDSYNYPAASALKDRATPTANTNFASLDALGLENRYPGPFSVNGIGSRTGISGALASLVLHDDQKFPVTSCVLTVPSIQPTPLVLFFNLRTEQKRRTFDMEKDGVVEPIVIQQFSHNALIVGPHLMDLRRKHFRK
jgi:hypothetical protein